MKKNKTYDCIEMQREIRDMILVESNFDLHTIVQNVKQNNKTSSIYKYLIERKEKEKQVTTA